VVPTFPVAPYVFLILYLALVLVLFTDLLDVLACLHVVKLTSAYLLLTSVIELTRKLLNILTVKISELKVIPILSWIPAHVGSSQILVRMPHLVIPRGSTRRYILPPIHITLR
jgi:chromate transport protein ChrA